jgi:hypothetical protein
MSGKEADDFVAGADALQDAVTQHFISQLPVPTMSQLADDQTYPTACYVALAKLAMEMRDPPPNLRVQNTVPHTPLKQARGDGIRTSRPSAMLWSIVRRRGLMIEVRKPEIRPLARRA